MDGTQIRLIDGRPQTFDFIRGLRRCAQHGRNHGIELVLRGKTGGQLVVKIPGDLVCGIGKLRIFQKVADDFGVDLLRVEIPRRLDGKAQLRDVVVFAVRIVHLAQEEVSGHLKCAGNADDALVTQLVRLAADEAAQRTLRAADFRGQLCLRDPPGLHQVLNTVADFSGEIYLIHCCKRLLFRQNLSQICCMIFSSIAYNFHKV